LGRLQQPGNSHLHRAGTEIGLTCPEERKKQMERNGKINVHDKFVWIYFGRKLTLHFMTDNLISLLNLPNSFENPY